MRIITIVGARPQFIKAAVVSRAIAQSGSDIEEKIIHTGQHYDPNMSQIFFDELNIPKPHYQLGVSRKSHGAMTGEILAKIEEVLLEEKPDWVLVYGDTNSTLAGALAAAKLHIPVAHVEAGLRSFNKKMPEEINRIMSDHVSKVLLAPTETAIQNLHNEGLGHLGHNVGDVMYDASLYYRDVAKERYDTLRRLGLEKGAYILSTCHRAENTNDLNRLTTILSALNEISQDKPVILPLHPRTRAIINDNNLLKYCDNITIIDPVSFLEMVQLEENASAIITDSGGVQKEAYFFKVPCITMRDETEWVETVESGWNVITGADKEKIISAYRDIDPNKSWVSLYGAGDCGQKIVTILQELNE